VDTWEEIYHSSPGDGYEWDDFDVRWTGEQFAWSQQRGCSCLSFEYDQSKYQVGDKATLIRAIYDWNGGGFGSPLTVIQLIEKIYESGH
jgi:hypothetical protein